MAAFIVEATDDFGEGGYRKVNEFATKREALAYARAIRKHTWSKRKKVRVRIDFARTVRY